MPDKTLKTISASQAAALLGVSPYYTPRALFDHFHDKIDIDAKDNKRMDFGKFVQKYICMRTSEEFNLEVIENEDDKYIRHKTLPFGTTLDAHMNEPSAKGRAVVEAKSVSYQVFKNEWTSTKAPLHIEVQMQVQLLVTGWKWGIIACMIGADEDFRYFERTPDKAAFKRLEEVGKQFFADLKAHKRPPVFGHAIELRGLEALYPIAKVHTVADYHDDPEVGDLLRRYNYHREQRLFNSREEDSLKIKILDKSKDAGRIIGYGAEAIIKKTPMREQEIVKRESLRTSIKVIEHENVEPLPEVGGFAA